MILHILLILCSSILLLEVFACYSSIPDRKITISIIQTIFLLPLLSFEYLYFARTPSFDAIQILFFSECVFITIWTLLGLRLHQAPRISVAPLQARPAVETLGVFLFAGMTAYYFVFSPNLVFGFKGIYVQTLSPLYIACICMIISVFYVSWRLEVFWRGMSTSQRWEYKFFIVGAYLLCGTMAWSASYRLTYATVEGKHLEVLSALCFISWSCMVYAILRYRLLNRKIFVSRKIVYSFVIPSLFTAYLIGFGLISLLIKALGLSMPYILKWLFIFTGVFFLLLFNFSPQLRRRIQFFISTHFYINKYEYRDEWLALSEALQGATQLDDVVTALRKVLLDCLYTSSLYIWLVDETGEFQLAAADGNQLLTPEQHMLVRENGLPEYLEKNAYLYIYEDTPGPDWHLVTGKKHHSVPEQIVLYSAVASSDQLVGVIGLGPEYTGGRYGHDDFDLLSALGSQAASAIIAMLNAQKLIVEKEKRVRDQISAFVLHDVKNAASMLSLLRNNMPDHIHEPEFQEDLRELIDDVLKRMQKVEVRLSDTPAEEKKPPPQGQLSSVIAAIVQKLNVSIPQIPITVSSAGEGAVQTEPEKLQAILENIVINAYQAGATRIDLSYGIDAGTSHFFINVCDNGPGFPEDLLPDRLFLPYETRKANGSGIGLWQVKKTIEALNGSIKAENSGGAALNITLPTGNTTVQPT